MRIFPECEKIKREDMRECLTSALEGERFYRDASNKMWRRAYELFPPYKGRYDRDDPGQNAYRAFFHGDGSGAPPFAQWVRKVEDEFLARHGTVRSFGEACRLAADKWAEMIFGHHVQDNGDDSPAGGLGMTLGTMAKEMAMESCGEEERERFRSLMREYYEGGCMYESEGLSCRMTPYCDYHPNSSLEEMLVRAGVRPLHADVMCPWKTGVESDPRDNSVVVRGYQWEERI